MTVIAGRSGQIIGRDVSHQDADTVPGAPASGSSRPKIVARPTDKTRSIDATEHAAETLARFPRTMKHLAEN